MKYLITILLILLLSVSLVSASNQWKSEHDQSWEITITDCQGNVTIYKDCLIVYDDRFNSIAFMPNQGNIPTGNGAIIKILRSTCVHITMISE